MRATRAWFLSMLVVATPLPLRGETSHGVRDASWYNRPLAPSRFFTDPPRPSRFFTDPPSHWFTPPTARGGAGRSPADVRRYDDLIHELAERHHVEYALVKAMIRAESDFDRFAVSPKGAGGLMQLMPATAEAVGVRDVFLPRANIDGGCRYLRGLLDHYAGNVPLAVAAYNAGPDRVDAAGGVPHILETQEYLSRVLEYRVAYQRER
ncbi:MAG TPA: lytic transglycosylase domain-containing protein [Candidatus Binatia bacterium]|nr:lytic transglycosylase domain-containing protein [Candidatus Binatia bacterium]